MRTLKDLSKAEAGSYYTISGAGGDVEEWRAGYEEMLRGIGAGKPKVWYQVTGRDINVYADPSWQDAYPDDLTVLMFPLDGLDVGKLAIFKIEMQDRWFDDIVQNMRARNTDE